MKLHALLKISKIRLWTYIIITIILACSSNSMAQFNGGDGTLADPYQIANVTQLQAMNTALDKHFILTQNIDASITSTWNGGAGFLPIGQTSPNFFTGDFDGKGFTIFKLYINRPSEQNVGLFGNYVSSNSNSIRNVGLDSVNITGSGRVGALVGNKSGLVSNCYSTGIITANGENIGGLIGRNGQTPVRDSYSECFVTGATKVGGLIGGGANVVNCYATGNVVATGGEAGGLIGGMSSVNLPEYVVIKCYATGNITSSGSAGGLVGRVQAGKIDLCYSTGNITLQGNMTSGGGFIGQNRGTVTRSYTRSKINYNGNGFEVGGFASENDAAGTISDCFSEVDIHFTGNNSSTVIGGFIGKNHRQSFVKNCYTVGKITGNNSSKGAFANTNGANSSDTGRFINCYYNIDSVGVLPAIVLDESGVQVINGLTTASMRMQSSYPTWNFDTIWGINEGVTYPYIKMPTSSCTNTFSIDSIRACKTFTWINGVTYTSNNDTSTFVLPNAAGCDSIITLHLTIDDVNTNVNLNANVLSAVESSQGATYQWINCSTNTPIPSATNQNYTATVTGNYAVIVSNNSCVDTSACTNVVVSGINSKSRKEIKVYPNPSSDEINFELALNAEVKLIDALGRVVFTDVLQAGMQKIKLSDFSNGMYLLSIKDFDNHYTTRVILSK